MGRNAFVFAPTPGKWILETPTLARKVSLLYRDANNFNAFLFLNGTSMPFAIERVIPYKIEGRAPPLN